MKTMNKSALLAAAIGAATALGAVLYIPAARAQLGSVSRYTLSTETGNWIDARDGTNLGQGDDNVYTFSSPFDIVYDSSTIRAGATLSMTDDGNFSFGTVSSNGYDDEWVGNDSYPGAIAVFNEDLVYQASDGDNYWKVTGSAPHRTLVVEWYKDSPYYTDQVTSFELQIHETTGVIELLYADHSYYFLNDAGNGGNIGLNGLSSPSADYLAAALNQSTTPAYDYKFTPPVNHAPQLSYEPKSIHFGTLPVGDSETYCVTASSVGSLPLDIESYYIVGDTNFKVVSAPPVGDSLAVGSNAQFCVRFVATGATHAANFILRTDGRDSGEAVVSLSGIGRVPEASFGVTSLFRKTRTKLRDTSKPEYIPVTNAGQVPLRFNRIYLIGLNSDNYIISRMPQNPLPPDVKDSIGIRFTPRIEGRPGAAVVINTDAFHTPWDTVRLFGIGILPHLVITVSPPGEGNTVMFDSVALGDSLCQAITLTNPGSDTLKILKQLVTYGDYDFRYHRLMGLDTVIPPGGGFQVAEVCFKPLKVGTRLATIRFYTNIPRTFEKPARDTSQFAVNIIGTGVPYGQLAVAGRLNDTAFVDSTRCISDTLLNRGLTDLTVTGDTLAPVGIFSINDLSFPLTLHAGEERVFSICFSPSARGSEADTLTFTGVTGEKSITQPVFLTGVGVEACVSATPRALAFGADSMTMVGAIDTSCITVTNCGDVPATYTARTPMDSAYTLIPPVTSGMIPPDSTADFCVKFVPTAIGSAAGSVTITGGPAPQQISLGGVGAGVIAQGSGKDNTPVTLGTCDTFAIQVANNGNVAWTPGMGTISGPDASDFTIVSGPTPGTIAPGDTATVMVDFCASKNAQETMVLTFPNSNPAPVTAFRDTTTAIGTSAGVTIRTEENGFVLDQSYPNPTNGTASISITLPKTLPVRIDLLNAEGTFLRTAYRGMLGAGTQTITIKVNGLPSGTYFYMLTSGTTKLVRKMTLLR